MDLRKLALIAIPLLVIAAIASYFLFAENSGDDTPKQSLSLATPASKTEAQNASANNLKISPSTDKGNDSDRKRNEPAARRGRPGTVSISGVVSDEFGPLADAWVLLLDDQDLTNVLASTKSGGEEAEHGLGSYEIDEIHLEGNAFLVMLAEGFSSMAKEVVPIGKPQVLREFFHTKPASAINVSVKTTPRGSDIPGALVLIEEDRLTNALTQHYYSQFIFDPNDGAKEGAPTKVLDRTQWQPTQEIISNARGQAMLGGLSKGLHRVSASHPNFRGLNDEIGIASASLKDGEDAELDVLMRALAKYEGQVVEDLPEPIGIAAARAEVLDAEQNLLASATADGNGKFKFSAAFAKAVRLRVSSPGFASAFINLLTVDDPDLGQIRLARAATLNGIVVDENDGPIAGATVFINQGMIQSGMSGIVGIKQTARDHTTTTDGGGRFSFSDLAVATRGGGGGGMAALMGGGGGMTVVASATGYSQSIEQVPALDINEAKEVRIKLMRAGIVRGIVVNQDNTPVASATIGAANASNAMMAMGFRQIFDTKESADAGGMNGMMRQMMRQFTGDIEFSVTSDPAGRFEFKDMTPGGYIFGARHESYQTVFEPNVTVKSGGTTEIRLVLSYSTVLFGTYFDGDMQPKPNAELSLVSLGKMPPESIDATTDAQGRYRYEGLAPGSYRIVAGKVNGFQDMGRLMTSTRGSLQLKGGEEREYDFYERDPNGTKLMGRATLNGEPYKGTLSLGGGSFSTFSFKTATTDDNGNFEFEDVPLGAYTLSRGGMGQNPAAGFFRAERIRVKTQPEERVDVDFKTVTISGTVKSDSGLPLPADVIVFATPYRGRAASSDTSIIDQLSTQLTEEVKVAADGTFVIKDISPDTYTLTARSATAGFIRSEPFRADGEMSGRVLTLQSGVGTVKATVKNYVGTSDGGMSSFFSAIANFTIEDANGEVVNLGNISGSRMGSDSTANLQASEDGTATVTKEGLPVGTWTVTLQVPNYGPVTQRNVVISRDQTTEVTFELQAAGDLEIQFLNDNMDSSAVQDMRYTIKNSLGQVYERRLSVMDFLRSMMNPADASKKNSFVLADFPPDRYSIEINFPGYRTSQSSFTITSKQVTHHEVTLIEE